jgi:hypothetical protein
MHIYVILFFIAHFTEKNYVAIQFSLLQGKKNQLFACFFFGLKLNGHLIPLSAQGKIIK